MRVQNIRFGEGDWKLIQRQAAAQNVSASDYIRVAALVRSVIDAYRNDDDAALDFELLIDVVREATRRRSNGEASVDTGLRVLRGEWAFGEDAQGAPSSE